MLFKNGIKHNMAGSLEKKKLKSTNDLQIKTW
jgi:hypothetical protein